MKQKVISLNNFSEFTCDGKYCNSRCCQEWVIGIDAETRKKYQNILDPVLRAEIADKSIYLEKRRGYVFALGPSNKCFFLGDDLLCKIQKENGETYLTDTCATYPRRYTRIAEREEVYAGLYLSCPVVMRNLLAYQEFLQVTCNKHMLMRPHMIARAEVASEFSKYFINIQAVGLKILHNRTMSLPGRIFSLVMFVDSLSDIQKQSRDFQTLDQVEDYFLNPRVGQNIEEVVGGIKIDTKIFLKDFFTLLDKVLVSIPGIENFCEGRYVRQILSYYGVEKSQSLQALTEQYLAALALYKRQFLPRYPMLWENYLAHQWFNTLQPVMPTKDVNKNLCIFFMAYRFLEMMLMTMLTQQPTEKTLVEALSMMTKIMEHYETTVMIFEEYLTINKRSPMEFLRIWLPLV